MSRDPNPAAYGSPRSVHGPTWRLVLGGGRGLEPFDGPTNMAIDVALMESVKAGGPPVLRLYRWDPACLSFGRNQPTRGRYDRTEAAARGIEFVRRPTGGQAVLHDDELTYGVMAPVTAIGKPRAAYGSINRALVDGLRRLGVRAALSEGGVPDGRAGATAGAPASGPGRVGAAAPGAEDTDVAAGDRGRTAGRSSGRRATTGTDWDAACFRRPARGEVVVGGAKLVGSAQRMESRTILQHGSILVGGSQAAAEELLATASGLTPGPRAEPVSDPGWTTLERELDNRPGLETLALAVTAGFQAVFGVALEPAELTEAEWEAVARLRSELGLDEWTWRR